MANFIILFDELKGVDGTIYRKGDIVEGQCLASDAAGLKYLQARGGDNLRGIGAVEETDMALFTQASATNVVAQKDAEIAELKNQLLDAQLEAETLRAAAKSAESPTTPPKTDTTKTDPNAGK